MPTTWDSRKSEKFVWKVLEGAQHQNYGDDFGSLQLALNLVTKVGMSEYCRNILCIIYKAINGASIP
jgi:hypothetical protein